MLEDSPHHPNHTAKNKRAPGTGQANANAISISGIGVSRPADDVVGYDK
jgi:hypothetical protein